MERFVQISLSRLVEKQLQKLPSYIKDHFEEWIDSIEKIGLIETRKLSGYYDEPLQGKRKGQRSIRLSRSYRVIYKVSETGDLILIMILEVNKHEY